MDNIFIERLWRSIKYEEVHLKAYADGREAAPRHPEQDDLLQCSTPSSGDEQPDADGGVARRHGQNRGGGEAVDMPLRLDNANALPTYPHHNQHETAILEGPGQGPITHNSNDP